MSAYDDEYGWRPGNASDRPAGSGLPNNAEAEANILAAMILSPEALEEILSDLVKDDFYRPVHRTIFGAMLDMYAGNVPVDSISLIDHLHSAGELEGVGGEAYILELVGNTLSLANWQHHAKIVKRDAMLRQIIDATNRINDLARRAPEDTKEVVERAESMLLSVTDREVKNSFRSLEDLMNDAFREAEEISRAGEVHGAKTGFKPLDNLLMGMREGQLVVIGARPAVGKTSFALNLALNAAAEDYTVGFFSLEMSGKEIAQRLICAKSTVELSKFRTGKIRDNEWSLITDAINELSACDILIDDTPGTTITEIRAKARRMLHNKEKALIILDYLQLVSPPAGKNYNGNRVQEVSDMSRGLKIMAKDLNVPVIMLSQLNRGVESRVGKRPQLSDLRESGSIEQDADIVMLLDRSTSEKEAERDDRPGENITRVIVAKNRSGPTGDVDLVFKAQTTKFYEVEGFIQE